MSTNFLGGEPKYEYDAWNRLTKVKTQQDALTLAIYAYDGLGRRIKKVVTSSAPFDGTTYFYYNDRWQMLESRNGSEGLDMQVIYGTVHAPALVAFTVNEIVRFERNGTSRNIRPHNELCDWAIQDLNL